MYFLKNPKKEFLLFIAFFFILNFIQSIYTGLLDDEAYYWMWSKNLAVGYFDHPPLVALWIKISSLFFNGELGIRFFSTISFSLTLFFTWLTIDNQKKWHYVWLFFLLIVSVAFLNVYGFVAVPDTPLLLFAAIFLFLYKQFLKTNSYTVALLLGAAVAGMLYSKYHGILMIGLVILSNLSLLKNKKFWLAVSFCILLLVPHILWQFEHEFISIKYQLFERSKSLYKFKYTLEYLVNVIVIIGIPFPIIYWAFYKQKATSLFEKGLKYIVFGFIIFFFLSTFITSTQAQWNSIILIPLVILTFSYFIAHKKERKWLVYLGLTNFFFMFIARVLLMNVVGSLPFEFETNKARAWAENIKEKTNGRPIVFINTYQNASKYNFYTGIKTHSFSVIKGRQSQYDLYDFEQAIHGNDITVLGKEIKGEPFFKQRKDTYYGKDINNYVTFQKIKCTIDKKEIILKAGTRYTTDFEIFNPYHFLISFENVKFVGVFQGKKNAVIKEVPLEIDRNLMVDSLEKKNVTASFNVPDSLKLKGLTFRIGLEFYDFPVGFQGNKVKINTK